MPFPFHLIEPFNPLRGHLDEREMAQRTFRLACVFVIVLTVPLGWLFHVSGAATDDPMELRWAVTALAAGLLVATFWSERVRSRALHLNQACAVALTAYSGWLGHVHNLGSGYAMGFLLVFVSLAMAHSLAYTRPLPFALYLGLTSAIAMAVAVSAESPSVPRAVFALCVLTASVVIFLTVGARLNVLRALGRSEAHLAEAQEAAGTGSWEKDFRAGRVHVHWSAGMFRLTGYTPGAIVPSSEAFVALVHPDDRERVVTLGTDTHSDVITVRYQRVGSPVWRHADVRRTVVRSADGRPERVFGTIYDTTDAREREAALHAALDRAEEAAQAKTAFLANMSHEIRTPLTAILGFAQLLADETGDTHRDLVEPIASAGQRLLVTLNSVLDLARMEAGQADLVLGPVDAAAEVRAVASLLSVQAAAKGIALHVDAPDAPLPVLGDAAALSRVLVNLASNAVKFTARGHVALAAAPDAEGVRITVCDTGRGMDAAFLTELFEPFRQASTGWARSHEGTGLGLTIVKRLVEGMGGTVAVDSHPGTGTTFTVRLPAAPTAPAGTPVPASSRPVTAPEPAAA